MAPENTNAPVVRFVGPGAFRTIDLLVPVEYDGKVYERVTISRMTVDQMRAFFEEASKEGGKPRLEMMVDCPIDLLDNLFPDDFDVVNEAIEDFLPRRLKAAFKAAVDEPAASAPTQPSGDNTAPSSPPNSDGAPPT